MPTNYWNTHTKEQIINFLKADEDFTEEGWDEDLLPTMVCETFAEWCARIRRVNNIPKSSIINKYFDFSRMLYDAWRFWETGGGVSYWLVGRKGYELYHMSLDDYDEAELSWCWVVMMNKHS